MLHHFVSKYYNNHKVHSVLDFYPCFLFRYSVALLRILTTFNRLQYLTKHNETDFHCFLFPFEIHNFTVLNLTWTTFGVQLSGTDAWLVRAQTTVVGFNIVCWFSFFSVVTNRDIASTHFRRVGWKERREIARKCFESRKPVAVKLENTF